MTLSCSEDSKNGIQGCFFGKGSFLKKKKKKCVNEDSLPSIGPKSYDLESLTELSVILRYSLYNVAPEITVHSTVSF